MRSTKSAVINFLVDRKYPFGSSPPPVPKLSEAHNSLAAAKRELHRELLKERAVFKASLIARDLDDLMPLYKSEMEVRDQESEAEEQRRHFNKPVASADPSWKYAALVSKEEAVALAFGKNPEIVDWEGVRPFVNVSLFAKQYKQLRNLVVRAVASGILRDPTTPKEFMAYLETIDHATPSIWKELSTDSKQEDISSHTPTDQSVPITEDLDSMEDQGDKAEGGGTCDIYPSFGGSKKHTGHEWREPSKRLSKEIAKKYPRFTKDAIAKKVLTELHEKGWTGRGGSEIKIHSVLRNGIDESLTFESQ